MRLFSKLFSGRKDEEMPTPVEVCQVVVDKIESREKGEANDDADPVESD